MLSRWYFLPFPLLLVALVATPTSLDACAIAPQPWVKVDIASESAIIVWDSETSTEHFIRRAAFQAKSTDPAKEVTDFGFLVPTPTKPELSEVGDDAFNKLADITKPKTETVKRPANTGGCALGCAGAKSPGDAAGKANVEVLEEKSVAGYDAAVLKGDEADALNKWLEDHGYASSPALKKWLEPLVQKRWIVTAFKISKDAKADKAKPITAAAVRISFKTDKPFYPYREPETAREAKGTRLLRVYYIGDKRVSGTIGESTAWPGKAVWAGTLGDEDKATVEKMLKLPTWKTSDKVWLTEFEDRSSPRPGTDELYFATDKDQNMIERPRNIVYVSQATPHALPMYAALGLVLAGMLFLSRRKV